MVPNLIELCRKIPEFLEEKRVFMLFFDGLGQTALNLKGFKREVYRTVFPSSTPTFFYSFYSLLYPKEHGFLEWYMRFNNKIVEIPPWKTFEGKFLELGKDVQKEDVFPFKSLYEILQKKGFSSIEYSPFVDSAFSKIITEKAEVRKISFISEIFPLKDADFNLIYWPSVDSILHERYKDEAFDAEKIFVKFFIKILMKKIPKNSLLFVLSDHGLVKVEKIYPLPEIDSVFPVGGGRVAFYKDLEKEEVEREVTKRNIPAKVFELSELEDLRGKINKRCYENFGNVAVIGKENVGFEYPFERKTNKKNVGFHGGLTREEIMVNVWKFEK
jgi:hypothetical protein